MMDSLLLYKILKNRTGAEISASGNPAIMSDTLKNNPMNEMKVFGWSKQETTKGKNLFDFSRLVSDGVNVMNYEKQTITVPAKTNNTGYNQTLRDLCPGITPGTYVFSVKKSNPESGNGSYFLEAGLDFTFNTPTELTDALLDNHIAWCNNLDSEVENVISEIQIEIGTEATDYEPYTGGQPSPSPDYPQEIVSAGMKWSTGAQLYDMDTRLNVDGIEYKKNGTSYTVNIVKISGNLLYVSPFQFSKEDVDATLSVSQFFNLEQANVRISLLDSESNIVGTLWADKAEKELSAKCSKIRFDWSKGGKFIVSDLMLNFGNTALPYEPYTDGVPKLYGDKVNVEVCGKNWLHIAPFSTKFQNGVTFEYVKPGGLKVTGTATANVDSPIFPIELEPGDYYADRTIAKPAVVVERNGKYVWIGGKIFKILQNDVPKYWYFSILQGDTVNATIYPRICKKEEAPRPLSISTPTGLPAIPVDSDGNYTDANGQQWISDYVDLKLGKLYKKVTRLNLKDVDAISVAHGFHSNGNGYLSFSVKNINKGHKPISNRYKSSMWTNESGYTYVPNSNTIVFVDDRFTDKQTAIKLVQNTYAIYALTSQIETDLTPEEIQAYKNLVTYAGTTIVENDAECYMEVSAGGGDSLRAKKLALILGE